MAVSGSIAAMTLCVTPNAASSDCYWISTRRLAQQQTWTALAVP
ncbi:hypothetical protein Z945_500 [Sulfitobacter noctilucae]|nr:hypothetical protein Z945_500 [Sulfitobacter noctilucae]